MDYDPITYLNKWSTYNWITSKKGRGNLCRSSRRRCIYLEARGCSSPTVKRRDGPLFLSLPPITAMANPCTCDETNDWYILSNRLIDSHFVSATASTPLVGEYYVGRGKVFNWWPHPALCTLLCPTGR